YRSLPSPTFWGQFFGKSLDRTLSFCFISIDERKSSSQGAKATSPRTARSDRDPARFATGSPDLPSPRLPEVPPGRRPPGLGYPGGRTRQFTVPAEHKGQVQRWLRNYRKLRAKLEAICELNHELLRADL